MSMRLGYDLTIEQTQKLVMTPELIQAIQILQYNTQELDSYVQEQLLTNPVLEQDHSHEDGEDYARDEGDFTSGTTTHETSQDNDFDWRDIIRERQYDDISYRQGEYTKDDDGGNKYEQFVSSDTTLPEHLLFQLQCSLGESPLYPIGEYIIESLDENGYMTMSEEMIAGELGASIDDVEEVLRVIHTFDPMGVGASSLSECLTIQLEQMGQLTDVFRLIIDEHLEDLASNKISYLAKKTGASPAQIQEMGDMIRMLEPKPGRQFASQSETKYIIPDVIVERIDGEYVITMNNGNAPHLMVSSYYQKLLKESERDEELSKYLSDRVNSAVWLIKSIEQRKQTIYNVVDAIVEYQRDYFDKGSKHLKPLTLRDIAERVGVHESTVSRTVNGKYMQSPHGVNELKYFFTAGVSSASGDGISRSSIKEFIKEIIDKEDPRNPISDQHIAEMLGRQQINISRRTVAKYRDEMNISPSSKRRRY